MRLRWLAAVMGVTVLFGGLGGNSPAVAGGVRQRVVMWPTDAAPPDAKGICTFARKERHGLNVGAKFRIKVRGLVPNTSYKVLTRGWNVGTIETNNRGRGRIRFRAGTRRRRDLPLDFDPTLTPVTIVTSDGTPVLVAQLTDRGAIEPSPSVSPSVSPFDGDGEHEPGEPSPTLSASVSPPGGGDGDGEFDDEPSPTLSPSASLPSPGPEEPGEPGEPSPTASASVSEDDVSPSVSDDEENSPTTPSVDLSPSPSDEEPSPVDEDPSPDDVTQLP